MSGSKLQEEKHCVIYVKNYTSLFGNKLMMELAGEFLEAYIAQLLDLVVRWGHKHGYQLFNDEQELEGHEHHIWSKQEQDMEAAAAAKVVDEMVC